MGARSQEIVMLDLVMPRWPEVLPMRMDCGDGAFAAPRPEPAPGQLLVAVC